MARREETNKEEKVVNVKETDVGSDTIIEPEKQQLQPVKPEEKRVRLNLGCGYRKMGEPDWINIDSRNEVNPDMVLDVTKGLPFDDNSVDEVFARDFLEHIPIGKVIPFIENVYRVLKPGGKFESITPDCEIGQGAFQDPFHVSFWCQNSWLYYTDNDHRNLYGIKAKFSIETMHRLENKAMRIYFLHVIVNAIKD